MMSEDSVDVPLVLAEPHGDKLAIAKPAVPRPSEWELICNSCGQFPSHPSFEVPSCYCGHWQAQIWMPVFIISLFFSSYSAIL
jgi:hypothetical protein